MNKQLDSLRAKRRKGTVLVVAAVCMVVLLAFVALSVDVGFLALNKTQLQSAADSAALGAAYELIDGLGPYPSLNPQRADENAAKAAKQLAQAHRVGELAAATFDAESDIEFGFGLQSDSDSKWSTKWDTAPHNTVRVMLGRGRGRMANAPLFFAPVLGKRSATVWADATAAVNVGVGFRITSNTLANAPLLPFTYDTSRWEADLSIGQDKYSYDRTTGRVQAGRDGIPEIVVFPDPTGVLPGGNYGAICLGAPVSNVPSLERWVLHGPTKEDLAYFGGEFRVDNGPLITVAIPGIKASIEREVNSIKGQPRVLPLYSSFGEKGGSNTTYRITRLVGVRIVDANLNGKHKYIRLQPATISHSTVVTGRDTTVTTGIYSFPKLVE